jgi:hypothetical protein
VRVGEVGAKQDETTLVGSVSEVVTKPIFTRPIFDPERLVEITAGSAHTCVRKANGNVYCWGRDDQGQAGRLPTASCRSAPNGCVDRPLQVGSSSGLSAAMQVDAGYQHTCAIDSAGKAFCWGNGDRGELGIGAIGAGLSSWAFEPLPVIGGLTFTGVSAGTQSTCGTTSSGISCWGLPIPGNAGRSANPVDLERAVAEGKFRADLHARLAHVVLRLPPLRERRDQLLALAASFAPDLCFTPDAAEAMLLWHWPRNVRELRALVEVRAALSSEARLVRLRDLSEQLPAAVEQLARRPSSSSAARPEPAEPHPSAERRAQLLALFEANQGNVSKIAQELGKPRAQVYRWLRAVGLDAAELRKRRPE